MEMRNYSNWNVAKDNSGNIDEDFYRATIMRSKPDNSEENGTFNLNGVDIVEDSDGEIKTATRKREESDAENKTNGLIDIQTAPYDDCDRLYSRKQYQFKPGVTVLVGCNGTGKTTLLNMIKDHARKAKVPCIMYDNLHDGGHTAKTAALFHQQFEMAATLMCSSEGEQISMNVANMASKIGAFVRQHRGKPEIWILFDAIDSGLSVDNVVEVKQELFNTILQYNGNTDVYIIVSANEYEMCRDEQCFIVSTGDYIKFVSYDHYRDFILASRKKKDQRYQRAEQKRSKRGKKKGGKA